MNFPAAKNIIKKLSMMFKNFILKLWDQRNSLKFKSFMLKVNKPTYKKFLILFILGALLAPIGDIVHVLGSTSEYPATYRHLIGIPWWIPLQFGVATIFIGLMHRGFFR